MYTGYTTDIEKRIKTHLKGTVSSKFTRSFKPVKVEACWILDGNRSDALKTEASIKKLSRNEKELLIKNRRSIKTHLPANTGFKTDRKWTGKDIQNFKIADKE